MRIADVRVERGPSASSSAVKILGPVEDAFASEHPRALSRRKRAVRPPEQVPQIEFEGRCAILPLATQPIKIGEDPRRFSPTSAASQST